MAPLFPGPAVLPRRGHPAPLLVGLGLDDDDADRGVRLGVRLAAQPHRHHGVADDPRLQRLAREQPLLGHSNALFSFTPFTRQT
jgi:hypothetical protein